MRILYTLLSYYYSGLSEQQLVDAFHHLVTSDQAQIQYEEWLATAAPGFLDGHRNLGGVNLKDRVTYTTEIFPALKFSRGAIHYYLSNLVFPKEMRVHQKKLSASGCDLAEVRDHPTTGFSGTDDNATLMPLSIAQNNRPTQIHTKALVLGHLLRKETLIEPLPTRPASIVSDAEHLLQTVTSFKNTSVQAILDVGAQVLDLENKEFARLWLEKYADNYVLAVVYFEKEEKSVMDRAGCIEPLDTSPYANQLNRCVVYLDEAHTRGTDLKLPRTCRAAVTLGPGVTKDGLVQAW